MNLAAALQIHTGVTAIIGAGGKTTLLLRLARELSAKSRVIVTTTTHIYPPEGLLCLDGSDAGQIDAALRRRACVCVGSPAREGKLGAPEAAMRQLEGLAEFVLVEADGAHRLPAKAHAAYEPAVPPEANQVILVFGLSALGRPIRECVHRPTILAERCGVLEDALLTPELAAQFINEETPHTRVLLNQADTPERLARGREMAAALRGPVCLAALEKEWILCLS